MLLKLRLLLNLLLQVNVVEDIALLKLLLDLLKLGLLDEPTEADLSRRRTDVFGRVARSPGKDFVNEGGGLTRVREDQMLMQQDEG